MRRAVTLAALGVISACGRGDSNDHARFAVDTDGSGVVDCADLDHVLQCLHHRESPACAIADVNHDGVVDDQDAHDALAGLDATGHHCVPPPHHHPGDTTSQDHHVDAAAPAPHHPDAAPAPHHPDAAPHP